MQATENQNSKRKSDSVTGQERFFTDGSALISKTDLKGNILYANQDFATIAAYTVEELLGQPHNIVRHPLMPKAAFYDLWETIKSGKAWNGIVVNRASNGDHYWVDANVAPVVDDGKNIGYISVRRKPTTNQKIDSEALYKAINAGTKKFPASNKFQISLKLKAIGFIASICLSFLSMPLMISFAASATVVAIVSGISILGTSAVGYLLFRHILNSIVRGTKIADRIATGDLSVHIQHNQNDEFGLLYNSLLKMLINTAGTIGIIKESSTVLESSSEGLSMASESLSAGTEQSSNQAETIAAAANEMDRNLQTIAAAVDEVAKSIGEVAGKSSEAADVAREANQTADETDSIVQQLGESATEIGDVIESIVEIANQTKMLALNASIEAAGAGDAGKGFAVVASEVKELARETAESSVAIKDKVMSIQQNTQKTVSAIESITNVIMNVTEISGSIASAVEEQAITTKEIANSINQTTSASNEVAKNIQGISEAAKSGAGEAQHTRELAGNINNLASDLHQIVEKVLL